MRGLLSLATGIAVSGSVFGSVETIPAGCWIFGICAPLFVLPEQFIAPSMAGVNGGGSEGAEFLSEVCLFWKECARTFRGNRMGGARSGARCGHGYNHPRARPTGRHGLGSGDRITGPVRHSGGCSRMR